MSLSPRELKILAELESELVEKDPVLVATLTRTRAPSGPVRWFPLTAHQTVLLLLALLVLAVLHALPSELGLVGSGLLTAGLIVPWMVIATRGARRRSDGFPDDHQRPEPQTASSDDVPGSSGRRGRTATGRAPARQGDRQGGRTVSMVYVVAFAGYITFAIVIALGVAYL